MTAAQQQKRGGNPYYAIQKQPAYNASSVNTIPAFGLVRVTGSSNGVLQVDQPNADGQDVYANGPTPILPNKYGTVTKSWPIFVAYDSGGGAPAIGQTWGVAMGSYLLTSGKSGFRIEAFPNAPQEIVLASRSSTTYYACIPTQFQLNMAIGYLTFQSTGLSLTLPPGLYFLGCQMAGTVKDPTPSPTSIISGRLQVDSGTATLRFETFSNTFSDSAVIVCAQVPNQFIGGSGYLQTFCQVTETAVITLYATFVNSSAIYAAVEIDTIASEGQGTNLLAIKMG